MEKAFYKYGQVVARYPALFIVGAMVFGGAFGIGAVTMLKSEQDGLKLW